MNKLISFIKQFTKNEVNELNNTEKIGRNYFWLSNELKELKDSIKIEPYSAGLPLGQIKNNKFMPSIALLDILNYYTDQKLVINKKGETMFLYGKDVFEDNLENIGKISTDQGFYLVLNEKNEVLGYGELIKKEKNKLLLNLLDRGDFLRRERQDS
jgi:60S ribosome subunit biogenesis protein NIP7